MKHFSIVTLILSASFTFAQDTLYTVSGEKISAKVLEITQTEIKYKKTNNVEGPTYIVDKTDIALVEYKNGSKELFGTGSGNNNSNQQVATNDPYNNNQQQPQARSRVNIVLGGGWGWGGWPVFNSWGWGGYRGGYYRSYYRGGGGYYRHHRYYGSGGSHHYHHGRR